MTKGLVVEIHHKYVILLLPTGEFVKSSKTEFSTEVGMEVTYVPYREKLLTMPTLPWKKIIPPTALALVATILFLFFLPATPKDTSVIAYISMDINPSVELEVNTNGKVLGIKAFNQDGEKVIDNITFENETVDSVVTSILQFSQEQNYVRDIVIISPVYTIDISPNVKETIMASLTTFQKEHEEVKVITGSEKERQEARKESKTVAMVAREQWENNEQQRNELELEKEPEQKQDKEKPEVNNQKEEQQRNPLPKEEVPPKEEQQDVKKDNQQENQTRDELPVKEQKPLPQEDKEGNLKRIQEEEQERKQQNDRKNKQDKESDDDEDDDDDDEEDRDDDDDDNEGNDSDDGDDDD